MALLNKHKDEHPHEKGMGYVETRQQEIVALDDYLKKGTGLSLKKVTELLKRYGAGAEYTDNVFYQRLQKLKTGEFKEATTDECQAITRFLHVENNPHIYGIIIHNLGDIERKTNQIERALKSGYYNQNETAKLIKTLKTLIPLSTTNIT